MMYAVDGLLLGIQIASPQKHVSARLPCLIQALGRGASNSLTFGSGVHTGTQGVKVT